MARVYKYNSWMLGSLFTGIDGIRYKILGSATTNDPFTGEITDAVRFREAKTTNDSPYAYTYTEEEFFTKIDSTDLKITLF